MTKATIHLILLFVVLTIAQAVIFNNICLFGVAVPLVFIYMIIKLPVSLNPSWNVTVAFLLGLIIDIFSNTQGLNALACTIIAPLRLPVLHLYFSRDEEITGGEPSARSMGFLPFFKYALTLTLIYCTLYFLIEAFTFHNVGRLFLKIIGSTILTFIIIIAIDTLTVRSREKRL